MLFSNAGRVTLTLGRTSRDVRVLDRAMTVLEDRVEDIAKLVETRMQSTEPYTGMERRRDTSFTDEQVRWLKEFHDERDEIKAGRLFARLLLWSLGSAVAGAATILLAYFKIRGG